MNKKEIRKIFREKRASLSAVQMGKLDDLILLQFQKIPTPYLNFVHSYIASEKLKEPDTSLILRFLKFRYPDIKIAAPKIDIRTLRMEHYHITNYDQIEQNIYGIDEPVSGELIHPEDIDMVIIPLLAFDERGYRVGYGKGYYDRFLSECRPDIIRVGLSFFEAVAVIDDTDTYDIPLDYCCTPHKLYVW